MASLKGQFLVASPELGDPNFRRSVVLMVEHSESGAMGLIVNRPLAVSVGEAWSQVSEEPCLRGDPLHQGGPCEGPLMVLHESAELSQMRVLEGVYLSTAPEAVRSLLEREEAMRFIVGYAGWGPGQLEAEMKEGAWWSVPATAEQVFSEATGLWSQLAGCVRPKVMPTGLKPAIVPEDPSLN